MKKKLLWEKLNCCDFVSLSCIACFHSFVSLTIFAAWQIYQGQSSYCIFILKNIHRSLVPPESILSQFLNFAFNPGQITLGLGEHSGNGAAAHTGPKWHDSWMVRHYSHFRLDHNYHGDLSPPTGPGCRSPASETRCLLGNERWVLIINIVMVITSTRVHLVTSSADCVPSDVNFVITAVEELVIGGPLIFYESHSMCTRVQTVRKHQQLPSCHRRGPKTITAQTA